VFLLFIDVRHAEFLHWDDDGYIQNNYLIKSPGSSEIGKMFTAGYFANWHPITWLSHALDIHLFGYDPGAHHIVNLVIHSLNAVLLFVLIITVVDIRLLRSHHPNNKPVAIKAIIISAFLASLWFSVHPLRIESFAWVSERKDVLCAFFVLLSTILYLNRFKNPQKSLLFYWGSFLAFVLAVMSKGMAVTLPIVFVLVDLLPGFRFMPLTLEWKLLLYSRELQTSVLEKIPFLIVSLVGGILVFLAQQDAGAVKNIESLSTHIRLLNAVNSIFVYISKTIFPVHLLPIYPYPDHVDSFNIRSISQLIAITVFLCFAGYKAKKGSPSYLLVSLMYLFLLLPILGILQVGEQPYADRYSYLPTLPFFVVIAIFLVRYSGKPRIAIGGLNLGKNFPSIVVGIFVLIAVIRSSSYMHVWRDDFTIWSYVINNSAKPAVVAYNNLGGRYKDEGQYQYAEKILKMGIERYPENGALYSNLRQLFEITYQYRKAIKLIERLETINGSSPVYTADKSHFYIRQGNCAKALEIVNKNINNHRTVTQLKYQAAYCLAKNHQYTQALNMLQAVLDSDPEYYGARKLRTEILSLINE
jgi:hypothetical protein